jgi:hypothetical protein
MPQVPYKPYPTAEAAAGGTGATAFRPEIPDVAFGTSIARAAQGFGQQVESSGNEMFNTALGLQRMANETAAKDTDVAFTSDLAKMQTQYETTEGVNAQAGLNKYIEDIQGLRQKYIDSAKNPEQRLLFANSIDRRTGYAIVDAGRHAATQTKAANDAATEARLKSGIDFADVSNPKKFQDGIDQTIRETQAKGRDKGWLPPQLEAETRDNVSRYLTNALLKHSPINPEETLDRFNEVKDHMKQGDQDAVQARVNHDIAVKSSQTEAAKLLGDDPLKAAGRETELLEKAHALADSDRYKDNPDFGRLLNGRIQAAVNLAKNSKRDNDLNNEIMIKQYVHGQDFSSKITSIDGVAGPGAPENIRKAYNGSDQKFKDKIDAYIAKENKLSVPYTPERQRKFQQLWGMSTTSPDEFSKLSLVDQDLDHGHIDQLIKRQAAIAGRTADDTQINKYMSWARPVLQPAGIGPSATDSAKSTQYNHFIGAMDIATREYMQENKKPPDPQWVRDKTQDLIKEVVTSKGWFGDTTGKQFEVERQKVIDAMVKGGALKEGEEPTDAQLQNYTTMIHRATRQ